MTEEETSMSDYFPKEQSIGYRMGSEGKMVLRTIADRYVSDNPPVPVRYYLRSKDNFHISEEYMEEIKLHEKFPEMKLESYVFAWARIHLPVKGPFHFRFSAFGPVTIYVNGKPVFRTNHEQERFPERLSDICLDLCEGDNSLFFECISTPLGCGFTIGSSSYKGKRIQFFGPTRQRRNNSGFLYSGPYSSKAEYIPELNEDEEQSSIYWYPKNLWGEEEKKCSPVERIFGLKKEDFTSLQILSVTSLFCPGAGTYHLSGTGTYPAVLFVDGIKTEVLNHSYNIPLKLTGGYHTLAFLGGAVSVVMKADKGGEVCFINPVNLGKRQELPWLYAGPFEASKEPDVEEAITFQRTVKTAEGDSFWRVDLPGTTIRPFNEETLYGEWSYPLGVTLYGLIQTARLIKDDGLDSYVAGHMRKCTEFYDYCMWDKGEYGAAPFHNQLTTIDSLDDCGSFSSALLEVMTDHRIPQGSKIIDMVAEFIKNHQQRLEDGTFYRNHSYLPIMDETLWADDMYMSIPFLCRCYIKEKEECYLHDAVQQVKNFFQYLYMPELGIMSHIFDTHYKVQTKVPWGRGNGWVLFSVSELLAVLPKEFPGREEVLSIFRKLCRGYLNLQGKEGMWHQVLTFPDSYEETSCTAMFIYGFARGVRYGWLDEKADYEVAAFRGWEALCNKAIDWKGNIYGVCRGSGYSFSKEYYARDLGWNLNDTHGIGIVLLAGIEAEKMKEVSNETDF